LLFIHKGYIFAVDVTADPDSVPTKMENAEYIFSLLQRLGVNFHVTVLMRDQFTANDLKAGLSAVISSRLSFSSITLP
jgi:hypothetical protein